MCFFFQFRIFGIYLKCEKLFADVGENFKQLILGIFGDKNLKIIVPPPLFAEETGADFYREFGRR